VCRKKGKNAYAAREASEATGSPRKGDSGAGGDFGMKGEKTSAVSGEKEQNPEGKKKRSLLRGERKRLLFLRVIHVLKKGFFPQGDKDRARKGETLAIFSRRKGVVGAAEVHRQGESPLKERPSWEGLSKKEGLGGKIWSYVLSRGFSREILSRLPDST